MAKGLKRDKALRICGLSKNQYYHSPKGGKAGRKKSKETLQLIDGQKVVRKNSFVKKHIRSVFEDPKVDYGYRKMTGELQLAGFYINHKKVYRLMKEERLLQKPKPQAPKKYVKYRILAPEGPLRLLEMDIKQVWVGGARRHAYILTILDVFSRVALYWAVGHQMRRQEVIKAWQIVIETYFQSLNQFAWKLDIEIRSDNGPQFSAFKLQEFLRENYFTQTFTHPYTPQENGHIESFHSILSKGLRGKAFENLINLEKELEEFYKFYNFKRIHGSTLNIPPLSFWQHWEKGNIAREVLSEQERKVKFRLLLARQEIKKIIPVGNDNRREVLSLHFLRVDPSKNQKKEKD